MYCLSSGRSGSSVKDDLVLGQASGPGEGVIDECGVGAVRDQPGAGAVRVAGRGVAEAVVGHPRTSLADVDKGASKVKVTPVDAAQTALSLASVDGSVINHTFLERSGVDPQSALYKDDPENPAAEPYINALVTRAEDKNNPVYLKARRALARPAGAAGRGRSHLGHLRRGTAPSSRTGADPAAGAADHPRRQVNEQVPAVEFRSVTKAFGKGARPPPP
jgi:hypothetical protein